MITKRQLGARTRWARQRRIKELEGQLDLAVQIGESETGTTRWANLLIAERIREELRKVEHK